MNEYSQPIDVLPHAAAAYTSTQSELDHTTVVKVCTSKHKHASCAHLTVFFSRTRRRTPSETTESLHAELMPNNIYEQIGRQETCKWVRSDVVDCLIGRKIQHTAWPRTLRGAHEEPEQSKLIPNVRNQYVWWVHELWPEPDWCCFADNDVDDKKWMKTASTPCTNINDDPSVAINNIDFGFQITKMDHVHRQSGEYKTITYCCEDVIKKMLLQLIFKCNRCVSVCSIRTNGVGFRRPQWTTARSISHNKKQKRLVSGEAVAAVASINFGIHIRLQRTFVSRTIPSFLFAHLVHVVRVACFATTFSLASISRLKNREKVWQRICLIVFEYYLLVSAANMVATPPATSTAI